MKRAATFTRGLRLALVGAVTFAASADAAPTSPAISSSDSVRMAPGPEGAIGAWLVIGPFHTPTSGNKKTTPEMLSADIDATPVEIDETKIAPMLGDFWKDDTRIQNVPDPKSPGNTAPTWTLASSGEGAIDIRGALKTKEPDVIAYAAGTLKIARGGKYLLLLGTDDGVRVIIDGKNIFTRDEARPERSDDDLVPIDLTAGDHPIVLKLHQRDGAWSFRVRLVDSNLNPPIGSTLELPGTHASDAKALAQKMSWVSLDRGLRDDRYAPELTVRFPEGAPLGVALTVHARLDAAGGNIFDSNVGNVSATKGEFSASLPEVNGDALANLESGGAKYEITVAGRSVKPLFLPLRSVRLACAHASRALATADDSLPVSSRDSVAHLNDRLRSLVAHGDGDVNAEAVEAAELEQAATLIDQHRDPYASRTGFIRRAYRSPVDDELAEYGVFVPASYKPTNHRKYPLIVALHGLNGKPMAMLRWIFGGDEKGKDQDWEERHPLDPAPSTDAFIVAPNGHGNTMYRQLGQDDIVRAMDEVEKMYPIDETRVTITGPSMGGIGTAALAFRHPDVFAAAEPLCGYHSYFVRRDFVNRPIRPWEHFLAEERSNVFWAENGEKTPLFIVHGTQDLPVANSGVLIQRYEDLNFSVVHEHPNLGHPVWIPTYANEKGINWLLAQAPREQHPAHVHFKTSRLRDDSNAWLHIIQFTAPATWGEVDAKITARNTMTVATRGVSEVQLDRDAKLIDAIRPITISIDRKNLIFTPDAPLVMHTEGADWKTGPAPHANIVKRKNITGPIRDAFSEPLLFVYGASDIAQTRANLEVAKDWARIRYGVDVHYPMMSDVEFFARGESIANDKSLFLVGNAKSNRVLAAIESDLPITLKNGQIVMQSGQKFSGNELGAAFIRPNPRRADRYVVVVEGVTALGTWRSLSLPDLLPDFVVYDEHVAPSRGQMLLGPGSVLAGGFFDNDWALPPKIDDPLARTHRAPAKSESDATPYLP
jgi:poly(3-hydroxybutyrate) depolymerase